MRAAECYAVRSINLVLSARFIDRKPSKSAAPVNRNVLTHLKRKADKEAKSQKKAEIEAVWKSWKEKYSRDVAAWKIERAKALAEGKRGADIPKKPSAPRCNNLPKLVPEDEEEDEQEDGEEETW